MADLDLLLARYWETGDRAMLAVWADALEERGDPRGEHLQLCLVDKPTPAQIRRRYQLEREHGAKLVGPAGRYLDHWTFGKDGLVTHASCAAYKLAEGFDAIAAVHPQLFLRIEGTIGSEAASLAALPLERIYHLEVGVISDANLLLMAPGFARVRHMSMTVTNNTSGFVSPDGLRAFGEHLTALELFQFRFAPVRLAHHRRGHAGSPPRTLPPCSAYADVVATCQGFQSVKVLIMSGAGDAVRRLPNVVTLQITSVGLTGAGTWEEVERLKRRA